MQASSVAPSAPDLSQFLSNLASSYTTSTALVGEGETISFADLDLAASRWASALDQFGCGSGTRVGLLAGNGPQWLVLAFAVWRCGATLVPLSTFATAPELRATVEHADISFLLAQPRLRSRSFSDALRSVSTLPCLQQMVILGDAKDIDGAISASDFLAKDAPRGAARELSRGSDPQAIACILYTSGTTGRAKGVMLSHAAILATVAPTAQRTGLDVRDRLISTLPLFWVAGLVIRALPTVATGCALILPEIFSAESVITLLREHRPTALHLRPPQVGQILGHPDFTTDLLTGVSKGGGRSDWYAPHLHDASLITGYGMTEMAGYVTALDSRDPVEVLRDGIGTPLPGVEIRIVDGRGQPAAPGVTGEIHVRGPGLFSGYHKEPAETGLTADGWFITGDLGSLDADDTFHFSGRSKDLLRIKGINVSPVEVEAVLGAHSAVEAAYVVGLPPDGLDQRLVALIVARGPVTAHELELHARSQLSHYKCPSSYFFLQRSEVPLGGTSKPQRAQLAAIAAARG